MRNEDWVVRWPGKLVFGIAAVGVVIGVSMIGNALSQPSGGVVNLPSPLTGTEIITVLPLQSNGQPGAYNANITLKQVYDFFRGVTYTTTVSGTVTAVEPATVLVNALTGAMTFTLPASPTNGEQAVIVNGSGTQFTFTITAAGAGTETVTGATAVNLPVNGSARWQYNAATTTWQRIA